MKENELPDYTPVFKKLNSLFISMRTLRKSFSFSHNDERARRDREFIEKWKKIRDEQK